jgi:hypothetical protein
MAVRRLDGGVEVLGGGREEPTPGRSTMLGTVEPLSPDHCEDGVITAATSSRVAGIPMQPLGFPIAPLPPLPPLLPDVWTELQLGMRSRR